jgi:hypothetical protein
MDRRALIGESEGHDAANAACARRDDDTLLHLTGLLA